MIFGSGKKAAQKELRDRIEGILSILGEMAPGGEAKKEGTADGSSVGQAADTPALMASLGEMLEQMRQRTTEMVSAQQRLQSEYKEFVKGCEGKDDLTTGGRYQLASEFFSYLVAEGARSRKAAESLGRDFAKLSEGLVTYSESQKGTTGIPGGEISEYVRKLREALLDLASSLSVDITGQSQSGSE
ncbi:MAG: hypothetical protein JW759_04745 [Candidatus Coatesbacteria bacterium]|nr:hypothetical protein [Candidatus Coatesbacteria bacterium]